MAVSKNFDFKVDDFEGDPALTEHFFKQVLAYEKVKNLSRDETILFLKSKFKGPALKYLLENPVLYNAEDFEFIQTNVTNFFSQNSTVATLNDLNNLTLLPHESIKNFAHRLNVLAAKVYPQIFDKEALDHIKFVKLLACLPSTIKVKLQEEGIISYTKAIDRAQTLQDIFIQDNVLSANASCNASDTLQSQIAELSERINNLNFAQPAQKKDESPHVRQKRFHNKQNFRQNFKTRYSSQSSHRQPKFRNQTERCQLCFRYGHIAKNCFKWQRASTRHPQQQSRYHKNNDNTNTSDLNY